MVTATTEAKMSVPKPSATTISTIVHPALKQRRRAGFIGQIFISGR
jgi:hypothetical protein